MEPFWVAACAVLVPGLLLGSWIDYSQRRVPNWLNATLAAAGFVAQGYYFGWHGILTGLGGLAVGIGVLIIPWLMHGMGAGDVKMMGAIGVWFGAPMTLASFVAGALVGGLIALVMILTEGKLRYAWANMGLILAKCSHRDTMFSEFASARSFGQTSSLLPYGIPLTIGSLLVLTGQLMHWWMI